MIQEPRQRTISYCSVCCLRMRTDRVWKWTLGPLTPAIHRAFSCDGAQIDPDDEADPAAPGDADIPRGMRDRGSGHGPARENSRSRCGKMAWRDRSESRALGRCDSVRAPLVTIGIKQGSRRRNPCAMSFATRSRQTQFPPSNGAMHADRGTIGIRGPFHANHVWYIEAVANSRCVANPRARAHASSTIRLSADRDRVSPTTDARHCQSYHAATIRASYGRRCR